MNTPLIGLAVSRLDDAELDDLFHLAERAVEAIARYPGGDSILGLSREPGRSTAWKTLILLLNRAWRLASSADDIDGRTRAVKELVMLRERLTEACLARGLTEPRSESQATRQIDAPAPTPEDAIRWVYEKTLGRGPLPQEMQAWTNHLESGLPFHELLVRLVHSPEAARHEGASGILPEESDGRFVQWVYELLHGRGAKAPEIAHWVGMLRSGTMQRVGVLAASFADAVRQAEREAAGAVQDGLSFKIMGTECFVTLADWKKRAQALKSEPAPPPDRRYRHRFHVKGPPRVLVSAIASLYKGGEFIEQFLDNITAQSIFDDYCELIIVDADSPENEAEIINRYVCRHERIRYLRVNYRIGIYDAWNVAVKEAQGEYLTNTNLDDLRRSDSFELQASVLDNLPFVDVAYQDFYYTFDPRLSFEAIARFGYESNLPILTPYNMMELNSPHNAPMWRKRLHEELGYFNTQYRSAGDYEFWLRCLVAGKCFYKLNDPHVIYYQNPAGLSTRADSRGSIETREILKTYGRKLVSRNLTIPLTEFCADCLPGLPGVLRAGQSDRYALTQQGLRTAARTLKYAGLSGAGP